MDFTPIFFKFSCISNNLLLSFTVSSFNPLNTVMPFEKDAAIEITECEYKGLVFQFGKVQFKEGEPHINFQRTIRRLRDIVEEKSDKEIDKLLNNKELEQVMGDILVEIMQDQIEREKHEQRNTEGTDKKT